MDCFKEDVVVSRNNLLGNILYVLCWVFLVVFGLYGLLMLLIGPAVAQELLSDGPLWLAAFLAIGNLAFALCDAALANITRLYHLKLRKKLHKIL